MKVFDFIEFGMHEENNAHANKTKEEAIAAFKDLMGEHGIEVDDGMIADFGIEGGETNDELEGMVNDYVNDLSIEMSRDQYKEDEEAERKAYDREKGETSDDE